MKTCSKCGIEKPFDEFHRNKRRGDDCAIWCKECISIYTKKYRTEHKEEIKQYKKENAKRLRIYMKGYLKEYHVKYRNINKDKINSKKRERRKTDPSYRLNTNISCIIRKSIIDNKNGRHWEDLVGYTISDLKTHLEKQFKDNMSWDNYGKSGWEVDHKIPVSLFNIKGVKSKGFKKCWSLENLQPLWASENASKCNRLFI